MRRILGFIFVLLCITALTVPAYAGSYEEEEVDPTPNRAFIFFSAIGGFQGGGGEGYGSPEVLVLAIADVSATGETLGSVILTPDGDIVLPDGTVLNGRDFFVLGNFSDEGFSDHAIVSVADGETPNAISQDLEDHLTMQLMNMGDLDPALANGGLATLTEDDVDSFFEDGETSVFGDILDPESGEISWMTTETVAANMAEEELVILPNQFFIIGTTGFVYDPATGGFVVSFQTPEPGLAGLLAVAAAALYLRRRKKNAA